MGHCLSRPTELTYDVQLQKGVWKTLKEPPINAPRKNIPVRCNCQQHSRRLRVLSIDGGGVRGIIPLYMLRKIERETKKPITDLFDLMAGTSVGGIITMALNLPKPGTPPGQHPEPKHNTDVLYEWLKEKAPIIFPSQSMTKEIMTVDGLVGVRYDPSAMDELLQEFFGDAFLSESVRDTLVVSYEITHGANLFFKSRAAWKDTKQDFPMWQVCRSTSAAPTYYPPCQILLRPGITPDDVLGRPSTNSQAKATLAHETDAAILLARQKEVAEQKLQMDEMDKKRQSKVADPMHTITCVDGGLIANNPTMCACAEGLAYYDFINKNEDIMVVSLGTGYVNHSYDPNRSQNWGALQWVRPLLEIMMDGTATATHFQVRQMMPDQHYYRFDVNITVREKDRQWLKEKGCPEKESILGLMDNTDPVNIEYLERRIEEYLERADVKPSFEEMIRVMSDELTLEETIVQELGNFIKKVASAITVNDADAPPTEKNITVSDEPSPV